MPDRIIHFAQDEKFINSAYRQFEALYPGRNDFFIISQAADFKYVVAQPGIEKSSHHNVLHNVAPRVRPNDLVIFHSLADVMHPIVLALEKNVPTVWFCFGYEIYNDKNFYSENVSFDKLTRQRFSVAEVSLMTKIKRFAHQLIHRIKPNTPDTPFEIKKKAIARIDYLASSFDEEFDAIQKLIGQKKKPFAFWYYPIENMVDTSREVAIDRPDIIVGNSGHATGNHLDVFSKLKDFNLAGRKVVVPLSYGNQAYIDEILPIGREMLGEVFAPLTDFYSLDDYNNILSRCGVAVLNCRRQQAVGNTVALIWFGSKVFLSRYNPFFHYLRRIGVGVYSYEDDFSEDNCKLLSDDEIAQNRKALLANLGAARLQQELKDDVDAIT